MGDVLQIQAIHHFSKINL